MVFSKPRKEIIQTNKIELFGKVFKFVLETKVSNSNNKEYREHLADFKINPAYLYCYYGGKVIASTKLTSREDKHLLLNNSKTEVIEEQKKHINIDNCFKLFDGILLEFDLSKNSINYKCNSRIVNVIICPSALGYVANGKLLKNGLDEKSIIWAFCKEIKETSRDHIIGKNNKIYSFDSVSIDNQITLCKEKVIRAYWEFGSNWKEYKARFGGTELPVSLSTKYALNGLLCGGEKITIGLNNQNTNSLKNYRFKDAKSEKEKENQIININRKPPFVKDSNKDAVVIGFSDFYLNKRIKEGFSDFLKN